MDNKRDYIYYDHTTSLCVVCHRQISAKIVFEEGQVFSVNTVKNMAGKKY